MTDLPGGIGFMAVLFCLSSGVAGAEAGEFPPLAPYQMVRSLQLAQDRIADGDQAALPMQKKMIEMIDQRFGHASAEEFSDHRNVDALMIYGMSGGNPKTFERVADRLHLDGKDRDLAAGILAYVHSDPGKAARLLAPVSPEDETREVAAFLSLIKGTVRSIDHPAEGLALLDRARLLAPGSLVEEAALRRSITLAMDTRDPARFLRISEQYVRRFLKSPYASHFADGFINGVLAMHDDLDMAKVKSIIDMMNADQQTAIYLRIARKSAIQGEIGLAEFASSGAEDIGSGDDREPDPRAEFYNALAAVTTEPIDEVAERLASIDRKDLSPRDARLLEAAKQVARSVMADPLADVGIQAEEAPSQRRALADPKPDTQRREAGSKAREADDGKRNESAGPRHAAALAPPKPAPAENDGQPSEPKVRIVRTERIPLSQTEHTSSNGVPSTVLDAPKQPSAERMTGEVDVPPDEPEMKLVVETRKRLDEIDRLLDGGAE